MEPGEVKFFRELPPDVVLLKNPSRGGLNMPKHQPCPECRARSKRDAKSPTGAWYNCRRHGRFFVRYGKEVLT